MRYVFILMAIFGIVISGLALQEHYREEGTAPCSINSRWDCGIVNKSEFAVIMGIPVAAIGIAGYLLLGALGGLRWYRLLSLASLGALGFSLYLTYIEAKVLGVYCIYCVISLGVITLFTLLSLGTVTTNALRERRTRTA